MSTAYCHQCHRRQRVDGYRYVQGSRELPHKRGAKSGASALPIGDVLTVRVRNERSTGQVSPSCECDSG